MLINNYEKLFLWKTNDKILAFLIKHAQGTRKERERTVRAMKMANIRESKRVASSSTSERTNYTTNSNRNRRLKKKEQIFNVAHRRSNQFAVLVPACVHTLLNFSFFSLHISTVCTSFSTIFSLLYSSHSLFCVHFSLYASSWVLRIEQWTNCAGLIDAIIAWDTSITRCYIGTCTLRGINTTRIKC